MHKGLLIIIAKGETNCFFREIDTNRPCALLNKNNDNALSLLFKMGNE